MDLNIEQTKQGYPVGLNENNPARKQAAEQRSAGRLTVMFTVPLPSRGCRRGMSHTMVSSVQSVGEQLVSADRAHTRVVEVKHGYCSRQVIQHIVTLTARELWSTAATVMRPRSDSQGPMRVTRVHAGFEANGN